MQNSPCANSDEQTRSKFYKNRQSNIIRRLEEEDLAILDRYVFKIE